MNQSTDCNQPGFWDVRYAGGKTPWDFRGIPAALSDARGQGRGHGAGGSYKVTEDDIDYHRKVILEVVCADDLAASIAETIRQAAHTGNKGDGIILVSELREVIRIRTGEKQEQAV